MRTTILAGLLAVAAGGARADVPMWFHTPSGNIQCMIYNPGGPLILDCEVMELGGAPLMARPMGCEQDWGHRFALSEIGGGAWMQCAGDTVANPGGQVLPYGTVTQFGPFFCDSSQAGLQCRNEDGHGFFLSRARQEMF